jgi:hypothetical protein
VVIELDAAALREELDTAALEEVLDVAATVDELYVLEDDEGLS